MRKILLIAGLLVHLAFAGNTRYAASFLELGVGARALGMGGAHVALSDDATGFYWNPGGLAFLPNLQAASMYANLFNTLETQSYGSVAMPIFGGATISVAWIRLSVTDIPRYDFEDNQAINAYQRIHGLAEPLDDEPVDYFGSYEDAYIISFAKFIPVNLDLGWQYFEVPVNFGAGLNLKMLRQSLDDKKGSGMGLDLGLVMRVSLNQIFTESYYGDLTFGLNVQDIANTTITWDTDSKHKDLVDRNFKYGFSYNQPIGFLNGEMVFSFDLDSKYNGATHLGLEYVYNSSLAVRVGSNAGYFTAGAGLYLWKFHFDYAYQSHDLGNSHRVSILFGL